MTAGRAESPTHPSPRRLALVLLVLCAVVASLNPALAAPAPLQRRHVETPAQKRERMMAGCIRRLLELGMSVSSERVEGHGHWKLVTAAPGCGWIYVTSEDRLLEALEEMVEAAEAFRRSKARQ